MAWDVEKVGLLGRRSERGLGWKKGGSLRNMKEGFWFSWDPIDKVDEKIERGFHCCWVTLGIFKHGFWVKVKGPFVKAQSFQSGPFFGLFFNSNRVTCHFSFYNIILF